MLVPLRHDAAKAWAVGQYDHRLRHIVAECGWTKFMLAIKDWFTELHARGAELRVVDTLTNTDSIRSHIKRVMHERKLDVGQQQGVAID
jgi:hypothetical protein